MTEIDRLIVRRGRLRRSLNQLTGPMPPVFDALDRRALIDTLVLELRAANQELEQLRAAETAKRQMRELMHARAVYRPVMGRKFIPGSTARAHAAFVVKSIDAAERTVTGWATTPTPDRVGDEILPRGCAFRLPLPFLLMHHHDRPIGRVLAATVTDAGISIKAQLARVTEAGQLKDEIDRAWSMIRHKLLGGLSVGFRAHAAEPLEGGGLRFTKTEIVEISAVTVPANPDCQIEVAA